MTREEAQALYDSKFWENMTHKQRAIFQLFEPRLCMPFGVFHEAVEKALGRSVWTHEFGMNVEGLQREVFGEGQAPTMRQIIEMIPADKRALISPED